MVPCYAATRTLDISAGLEEQNAKTEGASRGFPLKRFAHRMAKEEYSSQADGR